MAKFFKVKTRTKIILAVGLPLFIGLFLSIYVGYSNKVIQDKVGQWRVKSEEIRTIDNVIKANSTVGRLIAQFLSSDDNALMVRCKQKVEDMLNGLLSLENKSDRESNGWRQLNQARLALLDWRKNTLEASGQAEGNVKTLLTRKGALDRLDELNNILHTLRNSQQAKLDKLVGSVDETAAIIIKILFIGMALIVIAAFMVHYVISRHIIGPLQKVSLVVDGISRGDLSRTVKYQGASVVGSLGSALNGMLTNLSKERTKLSDGVDVLAESGARIAETAYGISDSATRAASGVTDTITIVNEMAQTARLVNERAAEVAERSERADEIASSGMKATADTIQMMNLIKEKMGTVSKSVVALRDDTQNIEDIIAAVQDLADQSNVLAVNASIEAARAGEQGKGFAVVAHEIKSLADESKEATAKVTSILHEIRGSVESVVMAAGEGGKAVQQGVDQSEAAGRSIQELADSIMDFSQAASVIFSSSGQQFARVEKVEAAMQDVELAMNSGVEGTRQLNEEAKRLEQLGRTLKDLVR